MDISAFSFNLFFDSDKFSCVFEKVVKHSFYLVWGCDLVTSKAFKQHIEQFGRKCEYFVFSSRLRVCHSVFKWILSCNFAGFDFGFKELKYIDGSLIVEATFRVIKLGEGG